MADGRDAPARGLPCPRCGKTALRVSKTRRVRGTIRRWRVCLGCDKTFISYEVTAGRLRPPPGPDR